MVVEKEQSSSSTVSLPYLISHLYSLFFQWGLLLYQVTLQAAVYVPDSKVHGPGPWPTLVSCYGGPHVQVSCVVSSSETKIERKQLDSR
jgi:hypothetical protein